MRNATAIGALRTPVSRPLSMEPIEPNKNRGGVGLGSGFTSFRVSGSIFSHVQSLKSKVQGREECYPQILTSVLSPQHSVLCLPFRLLIFDFLLSATGFSARLS